MAVGRNLHRSSHGPRHQASGLWSSMVVSISKMQVSKPPGKLSSPLGRIAEMCAEVFLDPESMPAALVLQILSN